MAIDASDGILLKPETPFQETMLDTNIIVRLLPLFPDI
jgi:hypothetical protein